MLVIFPSEKATASRQSEQSSLEVGKRYQLSVPEQVSTISNVKNPSSQKSNAKNNDVSLTWQTANVKSGDSLAKIFKRLGFNARTTHDVSSAKGKDSKLLKKLDVGDKLLIGKDSTGKLTALEYPLSKTDTLFVNLVDGKYQSTRESKTVEIRESIAHGVIKSNFWHAGIEAGLDDGQIISLANVFGWDIDFAMDIRKGDSFHVVYENKYIDGEFIGTGKILAAEFINQDDPFQAIRFTDGEYYSPDGKSMRKAFLRAPVSFKYISSNFKT